MVGMAGVRRTPGTGTVMIGAVTRTIQRMRRKKISGGGGNSSDASGTAENGGTSATGTEEKGLNLEVNNGEKEVPDVSEAGRGGTLYNEWGRKELELYEAAAMGTMGTGVREVDLDDEYDDRIDILEEWELSSISAQLHSSDDGREIGDGSHETTKTNEIALEKHTEITGVVDGHDIGSMDEGKVSGSSNKKSGSNKKPKRDKSGLTCEMKFLNSTAQLVEPAKYEKFASFNLEYVEIEERPLVSENWEPRFAGHQSLQERENSYIAHDQQLNCAFVKGPNCTSTGFDISEEDIKYMRKCHIAVSSCIFGNSDRLRIPFSKTITSLSKKTVCFAMFLDEITLQILESEGQKMNDMGFIGIWKIILIKNMPYNDMRSGKNTKVAGSSAFPIIKVLYLAGQQIAAAK